MALKKKERNKREKKNGEEVQWITAHASFLFSASVVSVSFSQQHAISFHFYLLFLFSSFFLFFFFYFFSNNFKILSCSRSFRVIRSCLLLRLCSLGSSLSKKQYRVLYLYYVRSDLSISYSLAYFTECC